MSIDYERCRDEYEWDDESAVVVGRERCERCGGEVDRWAEWVPCCGGEFDCEIVIVCYACHACRVMGDAC